MSAVLLVRALLILLAVTVLPFGSSAPEAGGEAHDAVEALKALRSLVRDGPTFETYRTQLEATRGRVDPYVDEPGGGTAIKLAVGAAMAYFVAADRLWEREVEGGGGEDPVKRLRSDSCSRFLRLGPGATADRVRQALWACASDKIGEAETLLIFR